MPKTIWKYNVVVEDDFVLSMPKGAQVLTVQVQHQVKYGKEGDVTFMRDGKWISPPVKISEGDVPALWAIVDPDAPKEERKFRLVGTGHALPDIPVVNPAVYAWTALPASSAMLSYIGSFQIYGGELVFHLFERHEALASVIPTSLHPV